MKNYLLTLVLFAFTAGQAQINSQVTNFRLCDDNTDGVASFDLTLKNASMIRHFFAP